MDFQSPVSPRLDFASYWLGLIDSDGDLPDHSLRSFHNSNAGQVWLRCAIRTFCVLASNAKLPLLAPVDILACRPKSQKAAPNGMAFRALLHVPIVDETSLAECSALLSASFRVVSWIHEQAAVSAGDREAVQSFHALACLEIASAAEINLTRGKSTFHILKACYEAATPFCHIVGTVYQLGWGIKGKRIDRSLTDGDSLLGARLTHNKLLTAQFVLKAGLPAPYHTCVSEVAAARAAAQIIGWPVVIKPADAERGEGVSVDVTPEGLNTAFETALHNSPRRRVLIERQVAGTCHRLFIAQGRFLYAVKRLPIGVYGNGMQSISDLAQAILAESLLLPPWRRGPVPELDELAAAELRRQGYSAQDIPAVGAFVCFRRIETTAWGGIDEDMTKHVHPENIRIAEAASRAAGLSVAGIDIISPDISKPWHENDAIINEVNYAPLLGEGAISRRYIPEYLERLMGGDGRIPVAVFVGDDEAYAAAAAQAQIWRDRGLRTALTSHNWTEIEGQQLVPMIRDKLHDRVMALVLSRDVEALIILVQNDGLVDTGLPLEGVDSLAYYGTVTTEPSAGQAQSRYQRLVDMLNGWPWPRRGKCD